MKKYAILENNKVINLIECEDSFIVENDLTAIPETDLTGIAYVGSSYLDEKFVLPKEVIEANSGGHDLAIRQEIDAAISTREVVRQEVLSKLGLTAEEAAALLP